MAKQTVKVPDIGGADGAEVIELLVAVGDEIELEQSLIVLESDKASMEIPSTAAGKVVELLVAEGQELSEGDAIVVVESDAEASPEEAKAEVAASAEGEASSSQPAEVEQSSPATEGGAAPEVNRISQGGDPAGGENTAGVTGAAELVTVTVPDIGSDDPVDLIEVSVTVGDQVAEGDSLVVLESDKASMEVPAPHGGEVAEILVSAGQSIRQGDALLVMRGVAPGAAVGAAGELPTPETARAPEPELQPASPPSTTLAASASPAPAENAAQPVYAGPAVRKLAREFGLDLSKITGTGPRGRLMKEDLHSFVRNSLKGGGAVTGTGIPPIPEVDFAAFGVVATEPLSKMAKLTAANMQRSWLNVPHVTQFDDADITELEAFRQSLKGEAEQRGTKLTPMPFILKACAVALRANARFCASLAADGQSLVYKHYVHIGMAVDTPAGLLVPVIRDVDKKSLWELAEEVIELAGKARDRKLRPDDMRGGCFTVSSLGGIGGRGFTPIVNAPEVGILGVSKAAMQPVWNGADFEPRKMLPLALSYDHRVINGGDAGRFLTQLVGLLSDIRRLVL